MRTTNITYTQAGAYFDDEVRIDLVIHEGGSDEIVLIIPGIDGSVDGYENKYLKMAEGIRRKNGATVIRMSNPHNLAGYHLRNLFEVMDYIEKNYDMSKSRLDMVAHSLGAYMVGTTASMYDYVDKVLLINPAIGLDIQSYENLKDRPKESNIFLIGENDPSLRYSDLFNSVGIVNIELGADHHFSGAAFDAFIEAPVKYLD